MSELLIGCGSQRVRWIRPPGRPDGWSDDLVTCDFVATHRPDVVFDLEVVPWPWPDNRFDEVHAYEVLEHLGQQGDFVSFFETFREIWRVLKPGGYLCGTTPALDSRWLWGDPGHRRAIVPESFAFLDQTEYERQVGKTAMSDYRPWMGGLDLRRVPRCCGESDGVCAFVLKAFK